ncbi:MAG: glycosyltransferase family 39 protein [Verrucomicrobia bacterium]|nr:glycosyltransferase family 39 protein [Verrucomicrobiota bacterium]
MFVTPAGSPQTPWHRSRPVLVAVVAMLLALHWLLAVASKARESVTADELAHLTGGFTYWQFNDYRIQPENGNLPQRWAALPAWLEGAKFPAIKDNIYWRTSDAWVLGHQFFYETGEDHFPRLMAGRAMIALFSVATGLLVFLWSRRLFGTAGGLVSLAFYAFSPNFLAHGALATSDVCMVLFFLVSVGAYWRELHDPRRRWWWASAVGFGLACVAKVSAVLILPMMVLMAVVRAWAPEPLEWLGRRWTAPGRKLGAIALSTVGQGVVAWIIIWAFFGFRYSAFNPAVSPADHFIRPWAVTLDHIGGFAPVVQALRAAHLLPEAFLYGFSFVVEMSQYRSGFLDGAYSVVGWTKFFPLAFLYKSTLPVLLACVAGLGALARRWSKGPAAAAWRADLYRVTPLLVLFGVYWAASLTSHLNIGHRHLLPTYPVLFILFGAMGTWLARHRLAAALVVVLVGWQVAEGVRTYPHYLAYFNPAVGGPAEGYRHLVDSSLDWGQDLPGLKAWLDRNAHGEPVYLSYCGSGEPDYYHIQARRLPFVNGFKIPQPWVPLTPGIYCISATMLDHVYSPIRGPWTPELEKEYQWMRSFEPAFLAYFSDPARRAELDRAGSPEKWKRAWTRHDLLRFARLCHYLRARQPDANIGYSILIYRLTAEEIAAATTGTLDDWRRVIEQAQPRR